MRRLPLIAAVYTASAALAACSTASAPAPAAVALSSGPHQTCASTLASWLHGPGGSALHSALTASSAMGAALESGSLTRVAGAAPGLDSAASRADSQLPPDCADHGSAYQTAMHDWMAGASDAKDGNLLGTSSRIASGAHVIDAVTMLRQLSPTVLKGLSRPVAIPAQSSAPATPATPAPAVTTAAPSTAPAAAPSTAPAAAPTQAATTPAGCHPLSNEGTCYEPGEYCRDDDHGTSGVAGDGEAITCEDNDGWRWEPA